MGLVAVVLTVVAARRPHRPGRSDDPTLRPAGSYRESALLPWSCEVVWALIKPAENAPLIEPTILRGYHVPGTPEGVGERQAFEHDDGTTVTIEVLEYEPNRWAVTRTVSPPGELGGRTIESLRPEVGGCVYTVGRDFEVPSGCEVPATFDEFWRSWARDHIERVRHALLAMDPPPDA